MKLNRKIRLTAAAVTAALILTSGCAKKPEPAPSESSVPSVSESVSESTAETTETTEQTTYPIYKEYGTGSYPVTIGYVILKNEINTDSVIHNYDGVKGLDTEWHGKYWIDITAWMTELHSYKIGDKYLKCGSPEYRYHVITGKNDVKITFVPVRELEKKTYDGFDVPDEVPIAMVNVEVTLPSGFKIIIADSGEDAEYDYSGSGRGWYLTRDQIALTEFLLELLEKDASQDPLSDIFEHRTVIKTNTYTV